MRNLSTLAAVALATFTLTLSVLLPRRTLAEEIADSDRQGEWDDDGMKFGDIVVRGNLVADGTVPGGWVLVRTMENKSDAPQTCHVEEHVMRTETKPGARVEPAPYDVLLRSVTISLSPHQKRSIGLPLPASIGEEITANLRARVELEAGYARALEAERYRDPVFQRTYDYFAVGYLKPLPPGATAAKRDNGVLHPASMPYPTRAPSSDGGALEWL